MVEFALVMPILLMLVLTGLDFGRVYLGWINVQNMARIGANFAANHPDAWGTTPNATEQTQYRNQILVDASATNCTLPGGSTPVVPPPAFIDANGGSTTDLGDTVRVQIDCTFTVITPFISNIVGGSVAVSAESNFPVKTGLSGVAGAGAGGGPILPNAAFSGNGILSSLNEHAVVISNLSPFSVEFRDTSGGSPNIWSWHFGDGTISDAQDPLNHTFSCATPSCTYSVSMTASNANGSSTAYMDVTVIGTSQVAFSANRQLISPGMSVTFTDGSAAGGTAWNWTFGDGQTGTGATVTHTYADAGTYDVTLEVTYPSPTGVVPLKKAAFISAQAGLCTVPNLAGIHVNSADDVWRNATNKFTGHVIADAGAPNGNFIITAQSLTVTSLAPCTSDVKVTAP